MGKRRFTNHERYAVYTVHGEKCYMCGCPLVLKTMEVDHIIPEALEDDRAHLATVLNEFGLPADFNLQSFANLLPACGPCNNLKRQRVFAASPLIQRQLQIAAEHAPEVAEFALSTVSKQRISKALTVIQIARTAGDLSPEDLEILRVFAIEHVALRTPPDAEKPIFLMPLLELVSEQNGVRFLRGPYGVGAAPSTLHADASWRCGVCGLSAWNGNRCVACGNQWDD
jgi:hypothetical protein